MRPAIKIVTEGLESSLREHIKNELGAGPLSESELWGITFEFFSPRLGSMASSLVKSYKLQFNRKIGKKTAHANLMTNLRLVLSRVKKDFLHTEKPIITGGNRFGRIFYVRGQEGKIQAKVKELIEKSGGIHKEVLKSIKSGPLKETPKNKRAVGLLVHYGLAEVKKISGSNYAVEPGYNPVKMSEASEKSLFPKHFKKWKPFKIETWVLQDGPTKVVVKFDSAAWDSVNKVFHVAIEKDYVGLNDLRRFREKYLLLGLPAKQVVFCKEISNAGQKYAEKWGINIKTF